MDKEEFIQILIKKSIHKAPSLLYEDAEALAIELYDNIKHNFKTKPKSKPLMFISFELTMPNVGSHNGKWTGADKKYYIIKKVGQRWIKSSPLTNLVQNGKDSWYYNFGDGWGAQVWAELIDSHTARARKKASSGFCNYDWMVDEIMSCGRILSDKERKEGLILGIA